MQRRNCFAIRGTCSIQNRCTAEAEDDACRPIIQRYFANYLIAQRRLSPQTLASYRDTFRLLLQFVHAELKIEPSRLTLDQMEAEIVLRFPDSLEQWRKNAVVSRNLRLTAIRSFFRMVALHHPECVGTATCVLAIPMKRTARRLLEYVTRVEMNAILDSIDHKQWCGTRDYALLLTMYNSSARVSEVCAVRVDQVGMGKNSSIRLHGNGRKEPAVPLWPSTARVLREWLRENTGSIVFPGTRAEPLRRAAPASKGRCRCGNTLCKPEEEEHLATHDQA